MPLDGSPKKFALDVASGLTNINRIMLKRYLQPDLQKMLTGLVTVEKELRTQVVDSGDFNAMKDKGLKMGRVGGAVRTIRQYAKENKITLSG